jgi:hypothetical protein
VSLLGATYRRTGRGAPRPFRGTRASPRTKCVHKLYGVVSSFFRSFPLSSHRKKNPWDKSCYYGMCLERCEDHSRRRNPAWPYLCLGFFSLRFDLGLPFEGRWAPDVKITRVLNMNPVEPEASSILGVAAAFNPGTIRTAFANSNITAEEGSMTATIAAREWLGEPHAGR